MIIAREEEPEPELLHAFLQIFGLPFQTNPELLEYLAANFVKNGMSIKKLHRDIMLSAVYQLSAEEDATASAKDSST